ncbi:MAG: hypothetical protein HFI86_00895 [Bacilli bacterium]|nr:hypothetical protein [Bacilli bacterium]
MNIDIKDVVTLNDDIRYAVVSKVNYENDVYYYLAEIDNLSNIKFLVENKERTSLVEIEDKELIQKLLPLFVNETKGKLNLDS